MRMAIEDPPRLYGGPPINTDTAAPVGVHDTWNCTMGIRRQRVPNSAGQLQYKWAEAISWQWRDPLG